MSFGFPFFYNNTITKWYNYWAITHHNAILSENLLPCVLRRSGWRRLSRFCRGGSAVPRPRESSPENHLNLMKTLWFNKGKNYATRRFTLDFDSIEKLRALVAIKQSRLEALS
ncbi:unnamed protein product [Linum trigynum]|uniref:Uncharacterized protein n=1 Tax=Linum trigynum TaxID=586398 RepID=A0AAV2E938_9ROSI